jgi:hypothetical protein
VAAPFREISSKCLSVSILSLINVNTQSGLNQVARHESEFRLRASSFKIHVRNLKLQMSDREQRDAIG